MFVSKLRCAATLILCLGVAPAAFAAPVILNEYNAVREDEFPEGGGSDPSLGNPAGMPVLGNGSVNVPVADRNDWFELVVIADHLDMRGWSFELFDDGVLQSPLVLANDALWSDLRAGTIITVFESDDLAEDLAYDPGSGDHTIAVRTNAGAAGLLITAQDIDVSHKSFQVTILDHKGRVMFGPSGEGVSPISGIGNDEIFELEDHPSELITPIWFEYGDGGSSTFGAGNEFNGGAVTQDFSNLRNGTPILDADQDGIPDCIDNCRNVFNPWQSNSDGDGFGNSCDPDFDNSNVVDAADEAALTAHLGEAVDSTNDEFDLNDDDVIDAGDLAVLQGFSGNPPGPGAQANAICDVVDPTEALFAPDRLIDVQVTMDPADWEALRRQTRDLEEALPCTETARVSPFTFFPGDVTIDGTLVSNVGVRKKGFQGSLSTSRPSLKIDLTEFVSGQKFEGMDRLTLNNNRQDPSRIDTCLAYNVMEKAGVPAPRCNFARVTVNGQDLGVYSNVESIKNPFLVRNFGNAAGNLYEGTLSDIRASYFGTFEVKNGGDLQDLLALAHLLEGSDAEIVSELANHIDVAAWMTFWALEGLVGHWDGYNGNNNNFFIYNDPATGLRFIPWGADATFDVQGGFSPGGSIANSVNLNSQLAKRLWDIPSFRAQFKAELFTQRDALFPSGGDPVLLALIDQFEALITPVGDPGFDPVVLANRRQWVADRFDHVVAEFAGGDPTSPGVLPPRSCLVPSGSATVTFMTRVTDDPTGASISFCVLCSFDLTVGGQVFAPPIPHLGAFDRNQNPIGTDDFGLLLLGGIPPGNPSLPPVPLVLASVDPTLVSPAPSVVQIPDGLGNGVVAQLGGPGGFALLGFMSDVEISFTAFGTNLNDPIEGTLTGVPLEFTPAPANPLPPLAGADSDSDGIPDSGDNCTHVSNAGQLDTDGDQFGNACDCDFDQSGTCGIQDFNLFLPDFMSTADSGTGTDMDSSGGVGIADFNLFLPGFSQGTPGPSGLVP
jgi:hypothetical protein